MHIYGLNNGFERTVVIDNVHSFIWTDRYSQHGDFELTVSPTEQNVDRLTLTQYIGQSESDRVMMIEEITHERNADGVRLMKVKGRSLEAWLENRIINSNVTGAAKGTRVRTGRISELVIDIVYYELVYFSEERRYELIPTLKTAEDYKSGRTIELVTKPENLYKVVEDICRLDDLGFRITLDPDHSMRFSVYKGYHRKGVQFSESLDNLKDTRYVQTRRELKNVAHVWDRDHLTMRRVVDRGDTLYSGGMDRRVLYVHASEVDSTGKTYDQVSALLIDVARRELRKHDITEAFDGTVIGDQFIYDEHYRLGDIVTIYDEYMSNSLARVTEYIWSYDEQGINSYPTFSKLPE